MQEVVKNSMAIAASMKDFLLAALRQEQRLDGRRPFESRSLTINFSREDGTTEVQLGQTRILCVVTCQLVQPYPDQPNEGLLVVHTEFSPMADPTFEVGRPGENAVELGRVIERGLRDSRAIDTESLCVLSGKAVWSLRVDIHVLDNGGNLIDAASIAALAALLSFRRPECSLAGAQGQDVVIYPPEVREPVPLIVHYLPIAFTFGFFGDGELLVMDPSYKEELVMRGRLTIVLNTHGDICAIQKGGGVGVLSCDILRCLQIAATKVVEVTSSLRKAVEAHELERTQRKIKKQLNAGRLEAVTVKVPEGLVMLDIDAIANILNSLDAESSSSDASSMDEEVIDISASRTQRLAKQEGYRASQHRQPAKDPLVALASRPDPRKEMEELSWEFARRLYADGAAQVQGSSVGPGDHRLLTPESDTMSSLVSKQQARASIRMPDAMGKVQGAGASPLKGKPRSLLDAVKWENVKRKKPGAMQG